MDACFGQSSDEINQNFGDYFFCRDNLFRMFIAVLEQILGAAHHIEDAKRPVDKSHDSSIFSQFIGDDVHVFDHFLHAGGFCHIYSFNLGIIIRACDKWIIIIGMSGVL